MLQHILNPAFLYSFEKGEGEQLLGPPNPEGDNPESITSVFITKVQMSVRLPLSLGHSWPSVGAKWSNLDRGTGGPYEM